MGTRVRGSLGILLISVLPLPLSRCGLEPSGGKAQNDRTASSAATNATTTQANGTASCQTNLLAELTYYDNILPIYGAKCTMCHSRTSTHRDRHNPDLTTYTAVKREIGESIKEMQEGSMPYGRDYKLAPGDLDTILAWRAQGMKEGTPPPPVLTPEPGASITYNANIYNLMASRCVSCHAQGMNAPELSDYQSTSANAGVALASVKAGRMPPSGKLPEAEIAMLEEWIAAGTPEGSGSPSLCVPIKE